MSVRPAIDAVCLTRPNAAAVARTTGPNVYVLQLCVALPQSREEAEPKFHRPGADTLPALERGRARMEDEGSERSR